MRVGFSHPGYEHVAAVEVPDSNLLGLHEPKVIDVRAEDDVIARALAEPIGAARLRELTTPDQRVLIIVDDLTRGTPVERVLGHVIPELEAAGVADRRITILTAQGSHRRMNAAELQTKLGAFAARFAVHQHDWLDRSQLHDFGTTSDGTRITANRLLLQSHLVIGIGSIAPHRIKGFSGGAKIVVPGVAGHELQARNQWQASQHRAEAVMGVEDNPMRARSEEAAAKVGLGYIINCIADGAGRVAGCVAGDFIAAHRAGCRLARDINEVTIDRRADIVIADSHPADRDLWQSAKGLYAGSMAVRDGGSLILVAPNPEGVATHHPIVLQIGYRPFAQLADLIDTRAVDDVVGVAVLAHIAQIVERVDCILVSPGIERETADRLGFRTAISAAEALRMAFECQGPDARVTVLRRGGHILPRIRGEHA